MNISVLDDSIIQRFNNIKDDIIKLVFNEETLQKKIKQLEDDLVVYKRIFSDTNAEKKQLEERYDQLKHDSDKQKEGFEQQLQASRVVALLDGDGAIFTPPLIGLGKAGGHRAASQLAESIKDYVYSLDKTRQFQLSVYIFFNKRGLADTFSRCGHYAAGARLEDFVTGFNQATERFMMVDVGSGKEAADSKIKTFLEDEIRLPQTHKVVFGGCHDNGYITTIRSQITSGFKQKLILLQSYTEHAAGFGDLELPVLSIPGLFISKKLVASPPTQDPLALSSGPTPLCDLPPSGGSPSISGRSADSSQLSFESGSPKSKSSPPTTYSKMLLKKVERRSTLESDASSDEDGYGNYNTGGTRRINPKLPLSKQNPPPCTLFYLANNCKHGTDCRYGHSYILDAEHYAEMKLNAKKSPCPAVNRDEICTWGDDCCYGHTCPLAGKCHFLKLGKCRFTGADTHKEPRDSKN